MASTYIANTKYDRLVKALYEAAQARNPFTDEPDLDEIKFVLGNMLDVWPRAIRADYEEHGRLTNWQRYLAEEFEKEEERFAA